MVWYYKLRQAQLDFYQRPYLYAVQMIICELTFFSGFDEDMLMRMMMII